MDRDAAPEPGWRRVGPLLDRGWEKLTGVSGPTFVALVAAVAVLRSGIRTWVEQPTLDLVAAFPDPLPDWRANSPLGVVLAAALGVDDVDGWVRLHAVALVVAAVVLVLGVLAGLAPGAPRRVAAVWLAVGSLPVVLLQKVGSYDAYAVVGAVLVVLPRRRGLAVLGGLVLGWTSPEQGAVGLVSAAIVLWALEAETGGAAAALRRVRSLPLAGCLAAGLAGVVVARVAVITWFRVSGVTVPGRDDLLTDLAPESIRRAVGAGGAGVFTWLGLGWALVVLVALVGRWRARPLAGLVAGLVVLPGAATILTLDGTRVFTMVSLPAVLVLLGWLAPRADDVAGADRSVAVLVRRATVLALAVAPLVPALVVDTTGAVSFPFPWPA
ncbi:MAG TPA: hypothetical protein VFU19_19150 [Iamia sp.]|nr:hypothetical protein [Iamia sp.]